MPPTQAVSTSIADDVPSCFHSNSSEFPNGCLGAGYPTCQGTITMEIFATRQYHIRPLTDETGVSVALGLGDGLAVGEGVGDGVGLGVGDGEGVGDGVGVGTLRSVR